MDTNLEGLEVAILVTDGFEQVELVDGWTRRSWVDRNLVSSRKPDDLPAFTRSMIERVALARQGRSRAAA
jgi:hypothetical protein